MPGIMVPKTKAESPVGSGEKRPFGAGSWKGVIEEIRVRSFPDWIDPTTNSGYSSQDGDILSIQLGQNKGYDGQEETNSKYFVDFVIRDGAVTVDAGPAIPSGSWQMQRSAASLANLALALGLTDEVELDGQTMTVTAEDFLTQLQDEALNGSTVGFTVYHRNWTSKKDGKTGTSAELKEFFTAV